MLNSIDFYKGIFSHVIPKLVISSRSPAKQKTIKIIEDKSMDGANSGKSGSKNEAYQLNIWKIKLSQNVPKFNSPKKHDFKKHLFISNRVVKILIDWGPTVSVCGMTQTKSWGILDKLKPSTVKIHPFQFNSIYNSKPILVRRTALYSVTFKNRTISVEFLILPGSCQPMLDGNKMKQLQIFSIDKEDTLVFDLVKIIDSGYLNSEFAFEIASIIQQDPDNFKGLEKIKDYQVKLYPDEKIRPVVVPPRSVLYHLQARVADSLENMIKNGVIEEHPSNEPAPWVSCAVILPKHDGSLRLTLDGCNLNKVLIFTNCPIPKQEDVKAQLSCSKIFSKLDFKSAFWQRELHPDSRYFTFFIQIINLIIILVSLWE